MPILFQTACIYAKYPPLSLKHQTSELSLCFPATSIAKIAVLCVKMNEKIMINSIIILMIVSFFDVGLSVFLKI